MSFDVNGSFSRSYNWQADRDAGIKILAQRMDGEFDNFAAGMNQTFLRTGTVPMTGSLNMNSQSIVNVAPGALTAPGLTFSNDTDTGLFSAGPGKIALVADGQKVLEASASGVTFTGTVSNPTLTGVAKFDDGIVTAPSIAFTALPGTGIWRGAGGNINFSVAGVQAASFSSAQMIGPGQIQVALTDTNFSLLFNATTPSLVFDTGDFLAYNRPANDYQFFIGATKVGAINATYIGGSGGTVYPKISDGGFYLGYNGTNPMLGFDTSDYEFYDRSGNNYIYIIGGNAVSTLNASSLSAPGTIFPKISDSNFYLGMSGANPTLLVDSGDYLSYDRTANALSFFIGSTNIAQVAATTAFLTGTVTFRGTGTSGSQLSLNLKDNSTYHYASIAGNGNLRLGTNGAGYSMEFWVNSAEAAQVDPSLQWSFFGNVSVANGKRLILNDTGGGVYPCFEVWTDNNFYFYGTNGDGSARQIFSIAMRSNTSTLGFNVPVLFSAGLSIDAQFYLNVSGGNPAINFDVNDYMSYDRTNNQIGFMVGGQEGMFITQYGSFIPSRSTPGNTLIATGYKDAYPISITASATADNTWRDSLVLFSGTASGQIITLPGTMNVGSRFEIANFGSSALQIAPAGGVSLWWFATYSGGTSTSNPRYINPNGWVEVICISATSWCIRGTGMS